MSFSGIIINILGMFIVPILSRLYNPEIFGFYGLFCSIVSYFSIIGSLRLEYAFFIKKKNISLFFFSAIIIAILLSILLSSLISYFFDLFLPYLILLLGLFSVAFFNITTQFSVALSQYKEISSARLLQVFLQYGISLLFGFYFISKGLIYAYIIGQLASALYLFNKEKISFKSITQHRIRILFGKNMKYCLNSTFSSALFWATPLAPIIISNFMYATSTTGIYFLLSQSISTVFAIPRRSLLNIYTSEFNTMDNFISKFFPIIRKIKKKKYLYLILFFTILLAFILILFSFFGENIISFFLGNKWTEGGEYLSILILYNVLELLTSPFVHLLNLWKKYTSVTIIEVSRVLFVYLIIPLSAYFSQWNFSIYISIHLIIMLCFNFIMLSFIHYYSKDKIK